ncbi:MAG: type I-E CRISPR-associated protein Cse2/CasB [Chloroflexi bacterium]|nr:type I-E CRISPR-associated protein Cse2/CasB [Chloroflexota bacterium]
MPEPHPFVIHLQSLAQREDRAALAVLRRGLGQPPGTVAAMYPYVVRWLPDDVGARLEAVYYTIAALYALHPMPGGGGNLGASLRRIPGSEENPAIERRFTALLAAHSDDLAGYLRQAVSLLKSKEVPIDWSQLMADIQRWNHPARIVQKEWARAFWGRANAEQNPTENQNKGA